jgi:transcriptional regulator with XRE-family HTH domain
MQLGEQIRALRKEQGLSLEQLAGKSGVAVATLSRLENGKHSGNFRTHQKIAEAMGLAVTDLYRGFDQPEQEATLLKQPGLKEAESFTYNEKVSAVQLTSPITGKKMFPQLLVLEPGGKTVVEQYHRGTERWVLGLEGEVEVKVGEQGYRIPKEGTLYFKASSPHHFSNIGKSVAKCVLVTTPVIL